MIVFSIIMNDFNVYFEQLAFLFIAELLSTSCRIFIFFLNVKIKSQLFKISIRRSFLGGKEELKNVFIQ